MMLDASGHVRRSACDAFSQFAQVPGVDLLPYLDLAVKTIYASICRLGKRNRQAVYCALTSLADSVGRPFAKEYLELLVPTLLRKLDHVQVDDVECVPLLKVVILFYV